MNALPCPARQTLRVASPLSLADRQHRTARPPHHLLRRRTEERQCRTAATLGTHDDDVGVFIRRDAQNLVVRATGHDRAGRGHDCRIELR